MQARTRAARAARAAAGALGLCAALAVGAAVPPVRPASPDYPAQAPAWPLREGDVVLRGGAGLWSVTFARLNTRDRRFSHAGVVVGTAHGWQVLHAQADDLGRHGRVRLDPWAQFAAAPALALLRADDPGIGARTARAAWAIHARGAPFDLDFDLGDATRVYCTELVWLALRAAFDSDPLAHKPIVHGRPAVLTDNLLFDVPGLHRVDPQPALAQRQARTARPPASAAKINPGH